VSDRVWLKHPEHGGYFECPAEAVAEWRKLGWEPADDMPPEPNPTVAEYVAPSAAVAQPTNELPEQTTASRRGASKTKES